MKSHFVAIDCETTMNAPLEIGAAHPMHPDNFIVQMGSLGSLSTPVRIRHYPSPSDLLAWSAELDLTDILVGMNMSFDFLYLYHDGGETVKQAIQKHHIWDIQVVEYIITGQTTKFASLDELAIKYGFPVKDPVVKNEYFKKGLGADHVPEAILSEYLVNDVETTLAIAKKQYDIVVEQDQMDLVRSQMRALHAIIEMMYNGLYVDLKTLADYTADVVSKYTAAKVDLTYLVPSVTNIDSPVQWSKYFFGGTEKVTEKVPDGHYKNGKPKFKNETKEVTIPASTSYIAHKDKISEKTGNVSVDEEVLEDIVNFRPSSIAATIAEALLKYRSLSKDLNTYVLGMSKHIIGNTIHGNINAAATNTGRLSSSNPNLQNISNNEIKKIFVSRFHSGGVLVEVDFNQLEIVILACITKDKQLMKDITKGTDIHSALYEDLYGRKPTKEERKPFKSRTFQLIYGAGARAIAKQAKCSLDEAMRFVRTFYIRYPSVRVWHETMLKKADIDSVHAYDRGDREHRKTYTYRAVTGRYLKFVEYKNESEYSSKSYSFSPTELKNYPVQSLATGDIVQMMLGALFDRYKDNHKVKMVNTVHDSILFDVKAEYAVEFMEDVLEELRNTHKYFFDTFGSELPIPLNASSSYGFDWFNMKETEL
jgi:DNA polymerase I-like protein with 3'-5' exonuclease and polymerase domains